jgi:hypothetical protein
MPKYSTTPQHPQRWPEGEHVDNCSLDPVKIGFDCKESIFYLDAKMSLGKFAWKSRVTTAKSSV